MDGTVHNLTAYEGLGAKILVQDREDMVAFFPHPIANHDVAVYPDPPHMFKLLRTNLADYKEFIWYGRGTVK